MKYIILLLIVLINIHFAFAQNSTIKGIVKAQNDNKPLASARVLLNDISGKTIQNTLTDKDGKFEFISPHKGKHFLVVSYIGYITYNKEINLNENRVLNLGNIELVQTDIKTSEIEVTAEAPIGEQRGDTTVFNASSFTTMPDASAEDLVRKMPGVQVERDGSVKAQGEEVKRVLVDGKPFFGDDPSTALKNLPSQIISQIQIFDQMSEQAQFTGFDDGQSVRTMNIQTRPETRNGEFGKFSVGGGPEEKYTATSNLNIFRNQRRISILGMSNNINVQNFAMQDIMNMLGSSRAGNPVFRATGGRFGHGGGGMRMQGGPPQGAMGSSTNPRDFLVGQSDGVSQTHSIGINYSDAFSDKIDITTSYFMNYTDNNNVQTINREYFLQTYPIPYYNENSIANSLNTNHRFNMTLNYNIDTNNSIMLKPVFTYQGIDSRNNTNTENLNSEFQAINNTSNLYNSEYSGINFSNELLYRHKFKKAGRTISLSFTNSYNNRSGESDLIFNNYTLNETESVVDTVNQLSKAPTNGYGIGSNLVFTEQLHSTGQLQLNYNLSYNRNMSDKKTYNFDYINNTYELLDTLLSNEYNNDYITNVGGIGYRLNGEKYNFNATLNYQHSQLSGEQIFPATFETDYTFNNFLPSIRFNYRKNRQQNLGFFYRTNISPPSIQQLQDVIDNSNPMQLSIGNPDLKQQYNHFLVSRYSNFSTDFTKFFFMFVSLNYRNDYIANSTFITDRDTIINGNVLLPAGGQIVKPVNLGATKGVSTFFTFGRRLSFIQSNLNLNIGGNYTFVPGLINEQKNNTDNYSVSLQLGLTSNISEKVDFNISSKASLNTTKNSLQSNLNNNYNIYENSILFKWNIWQGIYLNTDLRNMVYTGKLEESNFNYTLLNISIGKKIFKNERGEILLTVFDALNQNRSLNTSITDIYTESTRNTILRQYFLLTFTYDLRRFAG